MRRKRPSGPRVKLNPVAVWETAGRVGHYPERVGPPQRHLRGIPLTADSREAQPLGADAETVAAGPGRERLGPAVLH